MIVDSATSAAPSPPAVKATLSLATMSFSEASVNAPGAARLPTRLSLAPLAMSTSVSSLIVVWPKAPPPVMKPPEVLLMFGPFSSGLSVRSLACTAIDLAVMSALLPTCASTVAVTVLLPSAPLPDSRPPANVQIFSLKRAV